ncbi:hypothetical protein [Amycolatopsis sp. NPDC059021]|uniref:hypothetical protein n=1 Tax=Amycolatopsis sp. NPDC059021 TaxID=3346704 RepID=UPI00366D74DF
MKLKRLAGDCDDNDCAKVSLTEWGTVVVQGDLLQPEGDLHPGRGEAAVEISLDLLLEAARAAR